MQVLIEQLDKLMTRHPFLPGLHGNENMAAGYQKLIGFLLSSDAFECARFDFKQLKEVISSPPLPDERELTDARCTTLIFHLVNDQELLSVHYEYIDSDGTVYSLTNDEIAAVFRDKEFLHPKTLEKVDGYAQSVMVYFKPTAQLLSIHRHVQEIDRKQH